jgi:hypothetical protein
MMIGKMVTRKDYTPVIAKKMLLCDFPINYIMVRYIDHQRWKDLSDVTTIGIGEVKDFFTVDPDGNFEVN